MLVLLAATRLGGGPWTMVATLATALVELGWVMDRRTVAAEGVTAFVLLVASSAVFTLWPLLARQWLREVRYGRMHTAAEALFPLVRPLAVYAGGHFARGFRRQAYRAREAA